MADFVVDRTKLPNLVKLKVVCEKVQNLYKKGRLRFFFREVAKVIR